MYKKLISTICALAAITMLWPASALAAGISASGGGTKTVGSTFSISIVASGAEFNAFQGTISTSGPVSVLSVAAGSADTWMTKPSANGSFAGALLGRKASSLTIATIKLKGTAAGKGSVSVSGVTLKNGADTVGSSGGSTSFTIQKAPELPGTVSIASSSHPDQNVAYETTSIALSWNKDSGVDGFSYLLDQSDGTTPPSTITNANTSVAYENQAVGSYYFHIKAHKADGWGPVSQFKITVKEPDPKIDESLAKPDNINIERDDSAINNVDNGTLTGIKISGQTIAGYTANITLDPMPTIPEGKSLSTVVDESGNFSLLIDFPLKAGFYKLTVQGQKDKVLTPISDPVSFEISLKQGGKINFISASDANLPIEEPRVKGSFLKQEYPVMSYLIFTLVLAIITLGIVELVLFIRRRRLSVAKGPII